MGEEVGGEIGFWKSVKTGSTTDNGYNFSVICHPGGKINHRNKYQNGKEGHHKINNPERVKMNKKIR